MDVIIDGIEYAPKTHGDWNTGDMNTGDMNTGDMNTGHMNTGNMNTGDWNTGFCNTKTPPPTFFGHPTSLTWEEAHEAIPRISLEAGAAWVSSESMTAEEKASHPNHADIGGFLRECTQTIQEAFPVAWAKMTDDEKLAWRKLPNFEHCTPEMSIELFGVDITITPLNERTQHEADKKDN